MINLRRGLDEFQGRVATVLEHLKVGLTTKTPQIYQPHTSAQGAQQELLNTQFLYDARNREVDTENHMKQLAEREAGRIKVDLESISREVQELQDKVNDTKIPS